MKNIIRFIAFLQITVSVVIATALKGIIDSEDKSYIYKRGEYKCLSQKTLPKELTFTNTVANHPIFYAFRDDQTKCPNADMFDVSSEMPKHDMHFSMTERGVYYRIDETCSTEDKNTWAIKSFIINTGDHIKFGCQYVRELTTFSNIAYKVTPVPNSTCNYWFCLGRPEVIKQLHPLYPTYTLPTDKGNYYLSTDPLPAELEPSEDGMALDVLKMSQNSYTVHKMAQRPIQTIDITTFQRCIGLTILMDFDGTCTISIEPTISKLYYYVNGERRVIEYLPPEFLITFTYSTAYLYTFGPLGIYPLNGCTFDSSHASNAEYTLKVLYDKSQSLSCKGAKLRFIDTAAIKRWKTTTTLATTTVTAATTIAPTEPVVIKRPTSTASTTKWAIVAVVCFAVLIVIIVAVLLLIRFLKKL